MTQHWHAYSLAPIDFGFDNLKTVEQTAAELGANAARATALEAPEFDRPDVTAFLAAWASAKDAAREEGWYGDFRQPPVVFWMPIDGEFVYGFVIKQDTNGTTFVVSPVALPWLPKNRY
ncbi:hypothetical protein PQR64_23380 [Paraburkholderia phytofirmans]|uniref:hypothetical protein n=1 Tax=Paraburkholderia phytofirmans TaxID=261302 RepID=UPI0038B9D3C5